MVTVSEGTQTLGDYNARKRFKFNGPKIQNHQTIQFQFGPQKQPEETPNGLISDEEYYQVIRGRNAGGYNHYFRGLIREITPKMNESVTTDLFERSFYISSAYNVMYLWKKEGKINRVLSLRSNPLAAAKSNPYFLPRRSTRKNFGKRKSEFDSPAILDVDGIDDG